MHLPSHRRNRGVVLSACGLQKLEVAKSQTEIQENLGKRYTLEHLSFRTGLTPNTLMKVQAGNIGVDKRTLSRCFKAFNLDLKPEDYSLQVGKKLQKIANHLTIVGPAP